MLLSAPKNSHNYPKESKKGASERDSLRIAKPLEFVFRLSIYLFILQHNYRIRKT